MRVLLITSSFPPIVGGAEIYGGDLAVALSDTARVDVLAPHAPGDAAYDASPSDVTISRYERVRAPARNPFNCWSSMIGDVERAAGARASGRVSARLRAGAILNRSMVSHAAVQGRGLPDDVEPDVVVALSAVPSALLAAAFGERCRVPYVVCTHGAELLIWGRRPHHRALLRRLLRGADRVLSVSAFTERLGRDLGVDSARAFRLPPGIDVERFARQGRDEARTSLGIDEREVILLTHGRIDPRKGHDVVIRALPAIARQHPTVTYIVTGTGPSIGGHEKLAEELGVRDRLRFEGAVDVEAVPKWMAAADVFLMPSRRIDWNVEGFGIVALEAAACGVPVVAGDSGGIPDAVEDGVSGYLFDPESPEACANRVGALLDDPSRAREMGARGRARARSRFSRERFRTRVTELLDEVVGASRS